MAVTPYYGRQRDDREPAKRLGIEDRPMQRQEIAGLRQGIDGTAEADDGDGQL